MAIRNYTISKGVNYKAFESEHLTFYKKILLKIRQYNGSHTYTMGTIFQDHSKLDSNTIAVAIRPLVEDDPSIKVRVMIADVHSKFNYTISYRKTWLTKQKSIAKILNLESLL
ncbi:hypothetical protein Ahy_A09g044464 [Arachis hypogaea]|uniref:Uncharacterized protein n=1 Tax=Arachis hypogaea TaxID=3818 RepID=A0A445BK60_ARAHY|nr:hypothetical protein Ahy_A09g044464 [Arachis hypogaea]